MKTESSYKREEIGVRFYSAVRSEEDMEEYSYDSEALRENFYYGDIDSEGTFIIKHHPPQVRGSKVEPGMFCIVGKVSEKESGSEVEYSFERIQLHLEMWIALFAVCAVLFLMTVIRDALAGIIMLAVMAVAITLALTNPFEKMRLRRLLEKILKD